jgi:tetratricopeptide (TPR) repeat protein
VATAPSSRAPGPGALTLDAVPVGRFELAACGPGSLAVVFAALGRPVAAAELEAALPKAANGGVLTLDLMLEARARGLSARLEGGTPEAVASALASGTPPILALRVLDVPGERRDLYHYVVADGLDAERGLVRLQYGDGERRWTSFARLEGPWRGAGRAMVVIGPRAASEAAGPPGQLAWAVALEEAGRLDEAAALYDDWLLAVPESDLLWTNLGNVEAARGRKSEAEAAYRRALELAPDRADALNNLAWLILDEEGRAVEAEALARRAVEADGADPYLALDTLARAERRLGRCPAAVATAERALLLAPGDAPGRPELERSLAEARAACEGAGPGS